MKCFKNYFLRHNFYCHHLLLDSGVMLRNKEETLLQKLFKANFHEEGELTKPSRMQKWKNTCKFFIHNCCLSKYMGCFLIVELGCFFGAFFKFKTKAEKSILKIPKPWNTNCESDVYWTNWKYRHFYFLPRETYYKCSTDKLSILKLSMFFLHQTETILYFLTQ